jgi:protein-disulfide isomerase
MNKPVTFILGLLVAIVASVAISYALLKEPAAKSPSDLPDAAFTSAMQRYLKNDDNMKIVFESIQGYAQKMYQKQQADNRARAEQEAKQQTDAMEEQFKNPTKVEVKPGDPAKGPQNAKVTIVEFSDFECPYCSRGAQTMDRILKDYPQDVRLVFKNSPLPFHKNAEPAARAAYAAQQQGKFWEMHDALFNNQRGLSDQFYVEQAQKLGLNVDKFKADMNSEAAKARVKADQQDGEKLGIRGTPGFFVNGVLVSGAQPDEKFKQIIDRWLGKSEAK